MVRPAKPIISRQNAARAARDIIDRAGLPQFGLSQVAAKLGVRTPSLYHHFKGKDELLAEVARLLLIDGALPEITPELDWREEMIRISLASWRSVQRHAHCAPLLLQFFPRRLLIGAYDHWMHVLDAAGIPRRWHITILEGSEKLAFGSALFAASSKAMGIPPYDNLDTVKFPWLAAAAAAHPFTEEETFVAAMRAFLNGLPLDD